MSWLKKLKSGLGKTSARVTASLGAVLGRKGIDAASLEEVEDALISADLGTAAAAELAERIRKHKFEGEVSASALAAALSDGITDILAPVAQPLLLLEVHAAQSFYAVLVASRILRIYSTQTSRLLS